MNPPDWIETLDTADWEVPGAVTRVLVVANPGEATFTGNAKLAVDFRTRATPPIRIETQDRRRIPCRIVDETLGPLDQDGKRRWTFSLLFPVDIPPRSVVAVRAVWGEPDTPAALDTDQPAIPAWETTCHPGIHPVPGPLPPDSFETSDTDESPLDDSIPRVTIAIPTRNRPELLRQAVESALYQTFGPIEIVIGDDSDDEATARWVRELGDPSVRLIRNIPPLGQAANTNSCFDRARGQFVILLHDDDTLAPDCVRTLLEVFEQFPKTSIAFGTQTVLRADGTPDHPATEALNHHYRRTSEHAGVQPHPMVSVVAGQIPSNGWMVRTADARAVRFRSWDEVGDACDFDFTHRLATAGGDIVFVDRPLSAYRLSSNSVSRRRGFSIETTFEVIRDAVVPPEFEELRAKAEGERALIAGHGYADRGKIDDAWAAWKSRAVPSRARCTPTGTRLLLRLVAHAIFAKRKPSDGQGRV